MSLGNWIAVGVAVAVSVLLVTVLHWLLTHQLSKVWTLAEHLVRRCRYSAYAAASVLGVNLAIPDADGFENPRFWYPIFQHGMRIAGTSPDGQLVEIIEIDDHPWFVAVQFHPEFKSKPTRAHPLFAGFIQAAIERRGRRQKSEATGSSVSAQ